LDGKAGLGYTFCRRSWGVAPLIGWAYDELDLTVKNTLTTFVLTPSRQPSQLSDIDCKQTFNGPWAGVDLFFNPCSCWDLTLSYELHRAEWEGKRIPRQGDFGPRFGVTPRFANVRRHHRLWGNVFEVDCDTHFCGRYSIGCALKYQIWASQGTGHYQTTITPLAPGFTNRTIASVEWQSFSAQLQLGIVF
jgi:hypothetical protein